MKLLEVLPELVSDLESPLAHLGRPDLIEQLRQAELEAWAYDEMADTTTLRLSGEEPAELLSLYDEAGVNLEMDTHGRLCLIEVLDGKALARRLEG